MGESQAPAGAVRIDSWKAIARYLGRDERTVRRWERDRGLPVRRVPGGRGGTVFAYSSEIDAWLERGGGGGNAPEAAGHPRRWALPVAGAAVGIALLLGVAVRLGARRPLDLRLKTG